MEDVKTMSDNELVIQIKKDNRCAFDEIYARYSLKCYAVAFGKIQDKAISETISQSVFIDLWINRRKREVKLLQPFLVAELMHRILAYVFKRRTDLKLFKNKIFIKEIQNEANRMPHFSIITKQEQMEQNKNLGQEVVPTLTNGQKAVGLTFNPSGDDKVAKAKLLFAEAIDLLEQDFNEKQAKINEVGGRPSWYFNVFRTEAFNNIIGAQMAVVKFLTWRE